MSVPLIDLSVTSGAHLMLNVRLPNEQLWHGAFVAVFGDASNSELLPTRRSHRWSRAALSGTGSTLSPRGSGELVQASRPRSPEVVVKVSTL